MHYNCGTCVLKGLVMTEVNLDLQWIPDAIVQGVMEWLPVIWDSIAKPTLDFLISFWINNPGAEIVTVGLIISVVSAGLFRLLKI